MADPTATGTPIDCLPDWHPYLSLIAQSGKAVLTSGCPVNAQGNVPCSPESLRAKAEATLQNAGWWPKDKKLPLETYTLARYIQSEMGSGTVEERVAVGEAAVNRAKLDKSPSVNTVLLYRVPGSSGYGSYGPIHGTTGGTADVTKHSYGRWAATSQDPNVANVMIADFVLTGKSNNFNRGADDQAAFGNAKAYPDPAAKLRSTAATSKGGNYWVGPLPGVNHLKTSQMRKMGYSPTSPAGAFLLQRGIDAFTNKKAPDWSQLKVCVPATSTSTSTSTAATSAKASFEALPTSTRAWLGLLALGGFGAGLVLGRRRGHLTAV